MRVFWTKLNWNVCTLGLCRYVPTKCKTSKICCHIFYACNDDDFFDSHSQGFRTKMLKRKPLFGKVKVDWTEAKTIFKMPKVLDNFLDTFITLSFSNCIIFCSSKVFHKHMRCKRVLYMETCWVYSYHIQGDQLFMSVAKWKNYKITWIPVSLVRKMQRWRPRSARQISLCFWR